MRYVVFAVFTVLPLVIWPSIWTFFLVLGIGVPVAIQLMPEEKPSELDPALWSPNPEIHAERYAAALAAWKQRNSAWWW